MSQKVGYNDEYRRRQEQAERDEEKARQEREAEGERIRKERRAGLDAQKRAAQRGYDETLDAALAPRMATIEREWRIAHPGRDFAQVKPLVRQQLIEEDAAANHAKVKAELLARQSYPR